MPDDVRPSYLPPGADRYLPDVNDRVHEAIAAGAPQKLNYADWHIFADAVDNPSTQVCEADLALLGLADRWFLLTRLLRRRDVYKYGEESAQWLYARCREVEADPDDYLDLWAREHYKSTIITFAGSIQEVLREPEICIGLFSHTRPDSKKFLDQIQKEMEQNEPLQRIYPDVLWENPRKDAPSWSLDRGLIVKRQQNPKEPTIKASGLVDGQPTGDHYDLLIYDDVVTLKSITGPEMVNKTTHAYEMSDNLGKRGGRKWGIGTRYSYNDTYQTLINRKVVNIRRYPATKTGTLDGTPVFLTREEWEKKKRAQPSTVAAQMLQAPTAGDQTMFHPNWLRGYYQRPLTLNIYITADPSKGKKRTSDRCAMVVQGIDTAGNKYLLDGACHRMKLDERWQTLRDLRKKWKRQPGVKHVRVGYEEYGMQADIEVFKQNMERERYHFQIDELNWVKEGSQSKDDRIERLVPDVKYSRYFLPIFVNEPGIGRCTWKVVEGELKLIPAVHLTSPEIRAIGLGQQPLVSRPILKKNENNEVYDLTRIMIDDMFIHPFGTYDDLLDAGSRIYDMKTSKPQNIRAQDLEPQAFPDS